MLQLAFRTVWATIRDLWEEMFILIFCNLVWVLAMIPIVTLPAATGALFYLTHKIADGRAVNFADFKYGFRHYFRQSSLLGLANLVIIVLILVNLTFYGRFEGMLFRLVQIVFLYLLVIWLMMQLYIFPLLLEQEIPSLRLAGRNAVVLVARHPIFSLIISVAALAFTLLSIFLTIPVVILLASTLALLGNRAVRALLSLYREDKEVEKDPGWRLDDA
jgi:uncharacterized membrane protein YesL